MPLEFTGKDFWKAKVNVRVNTVNCVGVMGAGIALQFKTRYPEMFIDYHEACFRKEVKIGTMHLWKTPLGNTIVNFPTKKHWKDKSNYDWIQRGLKAFAQIYYEDESARIVMPALGCNNGRLEWDLVKKIIEQELTGCSSTVLVCLGRRCVNGRP